ncbi:MAG: flippase-like domain-containing protein [Chitinophagaceae bacterium]|nr:flippase-like domain-containing protein [Chitinophagaceae bacterium]
MSRKNLLLLIQYAIFFGLGFALIYWQYNKLNTQDIEDMKGSLSQIAQRWWLLILIFVVGFASHYFRAMRWRLMLKPLDINPSVLNATGAVMIGYLTNLLLPRMGEVAKCTVIARYEKKPADKIIGTIVAERAFDMICLLIITVITFLVQVDVVTRYMQYLAGKMEGKNLLLLAAAGIGGLLLFIGLLLYLYRKNKNGKLGAFIKGLAEGVSSILAMKQRGQFILYTVLIWGCYLWLVFIGFWALPATESLGWGPALSVLVFGSIGMIVTPGGLGAYPQALQIVLSMLYGIKDSFGLAFGWICWLAQTLIIIIFGVVSFLVLPVYNKVRDEQTTVDTA